MNEDKPGGLRRVDIDEQLLAKLGSLPEEEQLAIMRKLQDGQADVILDIQRAIAKSGVAENDLRVHVDNIARMDDDRKIYTSKISAETGSGKIDMQVRGGDTRFILPILVVVGVILLAVIVLVSV